MDVFQRYNISQHLAQKMADDANMALSNSTKSNYNTVKNNIARCEIAMDADLSFPWDTKEVLTFLAYLLYGRQVCAKTANCQLSGVMMAHMELLLDPPCLRPPIVKLLLKGREHWEAVTKSLAGKPKKAPVTIEMNKVIKRKLFEADWTPEQKFCFWCADTLIWNGSLRIHEILSREEKNFDPQQTMLFDDIEMTTVKIGQTEKKIIKLCLKCTKENRIGGNTVLEILSNGSDLCPVKAITKYMKIMGAKLKKGKPFFLKSNGSCYTGKNFNTDLESLTKDVTDGTGFSVRSHCFRAGVPSELAKRGATSEQIAGVGRWSSSAWKAYCKLHVTKRQNMVDTLFS